MLGSSSTYDVPIKVSPHVYPGCQRSSPSLAARSIRSKALVSESFIFLATKLYRPQGESNTSSTLDARVLLNHQWQEA